MPNDIAKSEHASTASYNLESSPSFPQGHIQFADRETEFILSLRGAHTIFVKDSAIEFILPIFASIKPETGAVSYTHLRAYER